MFGRLGGAAASNQDGVVLAVRPGGPVEMAIRSAPVPILPETAVFIEALNRPRIRITVVEVSDFLSYGIWTG
jgi:hypothetical protein